MVFAWFQLIISERIVPRNPMVGRRADESFNHNKKSNMMQNINDLEAGQIMLVVKNEDGSFSPIGISQSQAVILNRLLGSFSESEPFVVNREVKLVVDK